MVDNHRLISSIVELKARTQSSIEDQTEWRIKLVENKCNVVLTFLKSSSKYDYYFDSGSLRHMTWEKSYLSDLKLVSTRKVTFGDGVSCKIVLN